VREVEVQQALAMGRRLMREHGLDGWSIVADRAKTRAGVCRFARRQIGISGPLTALHSEDEVRDTLLHEIAHALVGPEHGHDEVWRSTAVRIGCSGERCVPPDAPRVPGDWVGRCPAGHERTRHRAPTRLMSCGRCSRRFDTAHLFTWSYRGNPAPLPPSYAAELADLRRAAASAAAAPAPPGLGDLVEVTAGPWSGLTGEVELVGAVRCQVRVDDELLSVPLEAVRPAAAGAVAARDVTAARSAAGAGAGDAA
jgi:predicted SprT family Zn-dependent metalloprotease